MKTQAFHKRLLSVKVRGFKWAVYVPTVRTATHFIRTINVHVVPEMCVKFPNHERCIADTKSLKWKTPGIRFTHPFIHPQPTCASLILSSCLSSAAVWVQTLTKQQALYPLVLFITTGRTIYIRVQSAMPLEYKEKDNSSDKLKGFFDFFRRMWKDGSLFSWADKVFISFFFALLCNDPITIGWCDFSAFPSMNCLLFVNWGTRRKTFLFSFSCIAV